MPAPSKKTKANITRLREMHAVGGSDREIGEALGIHHSTIASWREDMGLPAVGGGGPRSTRARTVVTPEARAKKTEAAEVLSQGAEDLPAGEDATSIVKARLATVRALLTALEPKGEDGDYPATSWARLAELEAKLAAALAELTPPTPVDPERDPANAEAADTVRRKLARLVGVAEESSRCCNCGKPPFSLEREGVGR